MDHPSTAPYPFPTNAKHDAPTVQPTRPVDHAPDEGAIDHGIEESFPASDPVSVNVTKAEPAAARTQQAPDASGAQPAPPWGAVLRTGLVAGACASVASTAVLAWRGRSDVGSYVAPTNAVSHVFWTQEALRERRPTMRHTLVGYAIHHASATLWALLYAWLKAKRPNATGGWAAGLAGAGATAAAACAIDYTITPQRLRPGFEHHLSRKSMTYVYAALAIGLALGYAMTDREKTERK